MNALSTIAAAVKSALAGASLGMTPAVRRCYVPPQYDTATTSELRLLVIAPDEDVDLQGENTTRGQCDHLYTVQVGITKRITAADVTSEAALTELDALSDFRERVIDFLKLPANRAQGEATLDGLKNSPAYDVPILNEKKTFVSVITLTYRKLR